MGMKFYIYLLLGILSYWGMSVREAPADFDMNKDGWIDCMDLIQLLHCTS